MRPAASREPRIEARRDATGQTGRLQPPGRHRRPAEGPDGTSRRSPVPLDPRLTALTDQIGSFETYAASRADRASRPSPNETLNRRPRAESTISSRRRLFEVELLESDQTIHDLVEMIVPSLRYGWMRRSVCAPEDAGPASGRPREAWSSSPFRPSLFPAARRPIAAACPWVNRRGPSIRSNGRSASTHRPSRAVELGRAGLRSPPGGRASNSSRARLPSPPRAKTGGKNWAAR